VLIEVRELSSRQGPVVRSTFYGKAAARLEPIGRLVRKLESHPFGWEKTYPSVVQAVVALQRGLIGLVLAASLSGCVAYAGPGEEPRYGYGVEVNVAPPPVRVVEVPAPRMGYVWAPGYWNWNGREHVWVEGRWIGERRGQHGVPEDWVEHNGNWRLAQGHWER
jgi:hypothetical protein